MMLADALVSLSQQVLAEGKAAGDQDIPGWEHAGENVEDNALPIDIRYVGRYCFYKEPIGDTR